MTKTRRHQLARIESAHHHDSVGPLDHGQRELDSSPKVGAVPEKILHQVDDYFSVCLRSEAMSFGLKLLAQGPVILHDPVLNDDGLPRAIHVGMSVDL